MKPFWRLSLAVLALVGGLVGFVVLHQRSVPDPLAVPKTWPAPRYDFSNNPVTTAGFALGRKLFYDAQLSKDGSVSCGSCHQQFAAFAQLDHPVSHGVGGANGKRNAPGLFNLAWQPQLMWDGAATHLETQAILPISNPVEMGESLAGIVDKLKADPRYPDLFEQAFGTAGVDSQRVLLALAQFTGSLVSSHSRYDRYIAGQEKLSADELAGLKLFREQCSSCHREPLFTDFSYRSNGLDLEPKDEGRSGVTAKPEDRGLFKVPSLRNVALTSPYMHDGRFNSLEQVLDHYDHGILASSALDPLLAKGIPLDPRQRRELLSFLDTLTDEQFVRDVRFADVEAAPRHLALINAVSGWLGDADAHEARDVLPSSLGPARLALQSGDVELVLVHEAQDLLAYVDDASSNIPLKGLELSLRWGNQLLHATEEGDGVYRIPAERIEFARPQLIDVSLRGAGVDARFQATLPAESDSVVASKQYKAWIWLIAPLIAVAIALLLIVFTRRRHGKSS